MLVPDGFVSLLCLFSRHSFWSIIYFISVCLDFSAGMNRDGDQMLEVVELMGVTKRR